MIGSPGIYLCMTLARSFFAAMLLGLTACAPAVAPPPPTGGLAVRVALPARALLARVDDIDFLNVAIWATDQSYERAESLTAGMLRGGLAGHTFADLPPGTYDLRVLAGRTNGTVLGESYVRGTTVAAGAVAAVAVAVHLTPAIDQPIFLAPLAGPTP